MRSYNVSLVRGYVVSINAEDQESARRLAEFYVGNCADASVEADQVKNRFSIERVDMTYNEAVDVEARKD